MIRNTLFILSLLLIFSCNTEEEKFVLKEAQKSPIVGLASSIHLNEKSTYFLQSEYFINSTIDSLQSPKEIEWEFKGDTVFLRGNSIENLSVITAFSEGFPYTIPIVKSSKKKVKFSFNPQAAEYSTVNLRGSFNAWNALNTPLTLVGDKWETTLFLDAGDHEYLLVCDGEEMLDPSNEIKKDNGIGGFNSILSLPKPDASKIPVLLTQSYTPSNLQLKTSLPNANLLVLWNNKRIDNSHINISKDLINISIPKNAENKERSYVRVWAYTEEGISNDIFVPLVYGKPITNPSELHRMDKNAMAMYFLMIDRFENGDSNNDFPVNDPEILPKANHYGGDLQGVIDKLESNYFEDLGINTIWLSPITLNPDSAYGLYPTPHTKFSGYHGYWPISSTEVDYRFGDLDLLKKLTALAHKKNMNVLIDYVANHIHEEHPIYKEHPDWVTDLYLPDGSLNTERWDDHRLTTWFDTFLPTLDLSRPEIVEPMTDSALYWLKEVGIDGFRHDATKHIPEIFWETLTRKIKSEVVIPEGREVFQIGETYGSKGLINTYIGTGKLDSQFDFNVYDDAVSTFARKDVPFDRLQKGLSESFDIYGHHNLMGYITGNQDRARFISYASGDLSFEEDAKLAGWTREIIISDSSAFDRLAMLHAFITTIPGIPVVYYGDEIGSPGGNDPDNRKMMKFETLSLREQKLKNQVSLLFKARQSNLALIYGDTQFLLNEDDQWVYLRSWFGEKALVVFNKSDQTSKIDITLPFNPSSQHESIFGMGENLQISNQVLSVEMEANSFDIIAFK